MQKDSCRVEREERVKKGFGFLEEEEEEEEDGEGEEGPRLA